MKPLPVALTLLLLIASHSGAQQDALPSWNDSASKTAILEFVEQTTRTGSPNFVPDDARIATFDNDGTLWAEKPVYFQLLYAVDRVKALAPQHPEWRTEEPFASVLKGDLAGVAASGEAGLMKIVAATHAGMTVDEFSQSVTDWILTARHPTTGKPYNKMVYKPMLELLELLRAKGYKTYIVSGGGIEFMRPWAPAAYGIPAEQIVGSSLKMKYDYQDGEPVLVKLPEVDLIDDKAGKPVGIQSHIGHRPVFAAGNSDGDFQMLEWTTSAPGPRLGLLIHHTDAEREWAYDRDSSVGKLVKALDEAPAHGWVVVDMKTDWSTIYAE